MLRNYISDPFYILHPQTVEFSEDLSYEKYPVAIADHQVRQLRTKEISMVKVLCSNHTIKDYMWETELDMQYPYLFRK